MKKETGGCHCGKVRFEAEMKVEKAIACNCSICLKRGTLLDFVPVTKFEVVSGQQNLTEYLFNKHAIHHFFCKDCGIAPFSKATSPDGSDMVAVNVRCLDEIDLSGLKIQDYDGKSR